MRVSGTIASTINLANKVVTYIQVVKGAKEDRGKLHSEISALRDLLKALQSRFDNTNANGDDDETNTLVMAGISDALLRCYEDPGYTVKELKRIASLTSTGKSSSFLGKMKNVKWPILQGDVKTMMGRTERLKSLVSLALQTSLM